MQDRQYGLCRVLPEVPWKMQPPTNAAGLRSEERPFQNNQWVREVQREIKIPRDKGKWKYNHRNVWNAAKTVLRGKFIAIQAYLKQQEKPQINNLTLYLKELLKEEQIKSQVSRRKKITKVRAK